MRGRKPKPTALKLLQGSRITNKNEPFPENGIPPAPDHLSKEALIEWGRVTQDLYQLGLLTKLDMASLAAYCQAYGRWVQAETALAREDLIVTFPSGAMQQNVLLGIANQAMEHMRKHLANFGMSPADRAKVTAKKADKETNPFAKFG